MNKAKEAVSSFLSKDGKHDTTVHESVNPAVTSEHVTRTQHENATKVVDREVHQDHHHTTVQPVKDREVLPEQHHHNLGGVEHRNINHGDDSHIQQKIRSEAAQFKNTREVGDVQHSASAGRTVTGEHVHHHVHENIQPVIQKETIQPSVVHTTIPVHEVHHNEAKHHSASALPAVSMDDFKRQGGSITGRDERTDHFNGEPRAVEKVLGTSGAQGTSSVTGGHEHDGHQHGRDTTHTSAQNSTPHTLPGSSNGLSGTSSHEHKKPSLMDKINPKVDANGDGKAGFMK